MGFPVSSGEWITDLGAEIRDVLNSRSFLELGLLNTAAIEKDFQLHRSGKLNFQQGLFDILQFAIWMDGIETPRPLLPKI